MTTTTVPDFLSQVTDAGEAAARADRHRLANLVAELAAGRRPSLTAAETAELLRRLDQTGETLEMLVQTRQRLDHLRLEAGREPEVRAALREVSATCTATLERIREQEAALRAEREQAEGALRQARADAEAVGAAGRAASDALGELLALLHPSLQHDLRTAASGVKVSSGKITELRRRIGEDEAGLRAAAEDSDLRPDLRAHRIEALEASLERLRKELAEVEEQHARAAAEREALATEAAALAGEEGGR